MLFLHKNGLNNTFNYDNVQAHVNKLEKFLDYKIRISDDCIESVSSGLSH